MLYVHFEQHEERMSGGAERRNEMHRNHETHGAALPAWHAKTPSLGACNQH